MTGGCNGCKPNPKKRRLRFDQGSIEHKFADCFPGCRWLSLLGFLANSAVVCRREAGDRRQEHTAALARNKNNHTVELKTMEWEGTLLTAVRFTKLNMSALYPY